MSEQWWFDTQSGEVSNEKIGSWESRMGPYDSRAEAEQALQKAKERNEQADDFDEDD